MQIKFLRSNSFGLSGTIRNADHHAKKLIPLVLALSAKIADWDFETWYQAHNIHVFRTTDGRNVILRAFGDSTGYIGIKAEVSMQTRCASGRGVLLSVLYADNRNGVTVDDFSKILKMFSRCSVTDVNGQPPKQVEDEGQPNGDE